MAFQLDASHKTDAIENERSRLVANKRIVRIAVPDVPVDLASGVVMINLTD